MNHVMTVSLLTTTLLTATALCHAQDFPEMPTPQKQHEWLQKFVGNWKSDAETSMGPDQPAIKAEGTQQARMLGGFWMIADGEIEMMGMRINSVLTLGYDTRKSKYVGTWTDSCHNYLWQYEGEVDDSGNVLTLNTEGPNHMLGDELSNYREVIEFKSDDHYVFSSMMEGEDGEWHTFMTAHFRRSAE